MPGYARRQPRLPRMRLFVIALRHGQGVQANELEKATFKCAYALMPTVSPKEPPRKLMVVIRPDRGDQNAHLIPAKGESFKLKIPELKRTPNPPY